MSNLILVRHGQSKFNLERRFTGFYDVELTSKGEAEAKYAGELIKKLNIELEEYFTSNLKRASNSLDIIIKVFFSSMLNEIMFSLLFFLFFKILSI